jgi:hypothetical protein
MRAARGQSNVSTHKPRRRTLDIVGSLDKLEAGDGALRDNAGAVAGFGAPGHGFALRDAYFRVWIRGTPEAEV